MKGKKRIILALAAVLMAVGAFCGIARKAYAKTERVFRVTDGAVGTFYGKGVITLKGKPGYFAGTTGTNTERVSIWDNKKYNVSQDYLYEYAGLSEDLAYKFMPTAYGKYKVRYAHVSNGSLDYIKTAAIDVVNPKKAGTVKPAFAVEASTDSVTLRGFDPAASTSIYRAGKKAGKFKLIKTVKADSFTDTTVKRGKTYYYRIRVSVKSGKKTYKTKNSKVLMAHTGAPAKPEIKSISIVKGDYDDYVRVKWDKKKYDPSVTMSFYYSDTKSGYGRMMGKTTGDLGELQVALGSLPVGFTGKTYYFQLRAYRDDNWNDDQLCAKSKMFKYEVPDPDAQGG